MKPPKHDEDFDVANFLAPAQHDNNISILLLSRQILREAYDFMVKTNRFVRVTSSGGFPLTSLLNHLQIPVVAEDKQSSQFKGYVLSVSFLCPKDLAYPDSTLDTKPCSLMLLGRDMEIFCEVLMGGDLYVPGFGVHISVKIAPSEPSPYKDPVSEFFSEATQQTLLKPFRNRLRGFKNFKVRGLVSPEVAKATEEAIAADSASDPEAVLTNYQTPKDEGQVLCKAKEIEAACLKWQDATVEIELFRDSSSWAKLVQKGGIPFVSRLAEMYFLMKLNIIHIVIGRIQQHEPYIHIMASDALSMARKCIMKGRWVKGYTWMPNETQRAKFYYRMAMPIRVTNDVHQVEGAIRGVETAHSMFPDDAAIAREKEAVWAWADQFRVAMDIDF